MNTGEDVCEAFFFATGALHFVHPSHAIALFPTLTWMETLIWLEPRLRLYQIEVLRLKIIDFLQSFYVEKSQTLCGGTAKKGEVKI